MKTKVGDVRPTQLLHTYGVGSTVDLPHFAALVMGLDDWETTYGELVTEERLLRAVRTQLGQQVKELRLPPIAPESTDPRSGPLVGVPVVPFPQWFRCPRCDHLAPRSSGLFDLKTDMYRPERARYVHANCQKTQGAAPAVLPARFQVACAHGHIDDFPWIRFVHNGPSDCRHELHLMKVGASDEAVDLLVRCGCGANRRMSDAFGDTAKQDPTFGCRGRRPHLRDFEPGGCTEQAETILLGASNSWFAISLSALSIPTQADLLPQLVEEAWAVLQHAATRETVTAFRAIGNLKTFGNYSDDEVWKAIVAKRTGAEAALEDSDLKTPEWVVFAAADSSRNTRDFTLREVARPAGFEAYFEKVVLADRLREVRALTGFTRIDSPGDYSDPTEIPKELVAPITRGKPVWVPVSEVRGEGVFLQFREDVLTQWCKALADRDALFHGAHAAWRRSRDISPPDAGYPGMRYALIHSLSHALIRQLAVSSGYSSASIRERIYANDGADGTQPKAGLLLYTAAPDSEGTLGGLVALGEPAKLGYLIRQALENIRLCASDPLCAEHEPGAGGPVTLHGAACHACMFAPETSCERGNKYLDRALLIKVLGSSLPSILRTVLGAVSLPAAVLDTLAALAADLSASAAADIARVLAWSSSAKTLGADPSLLGAVPAGQRAAVERLVNAWRSQCPDTSGSVISAALLAMSFYDTRLRSELQVEAVWTGPRVSAAGLRRTEQVLLEMICAARVSIWLVAFAAYKVPLVSAALQAAMARGVQVRLVLEDSEISGGKVTFNPLPALAAAGLGGAEVFVWPMDQRPRDERGRHGTLHAKGLVVDDRMAFITSANMTEDALNINMELGVALHAPSAVRQIADQLRGLVSNGVLVIREA